MTAEGEADAEEESGAAAVSFGGETASSTAAQFAMAALGFAGTIAFARLLGPAGFGGYYLLFGLVKLVDRPINGWASAAKKRYSEVGTPRGEVVGVVAAFVLAWVGVALVGASLAGEFLVSYTGIGNAPVLFAVLLVAVSLYEPLERLVQARGRVGAATWMDALRSLFTFPLQLGCILLLGLGAGGMAVGLAAATLLVLPVGWAVLRTRPELPSGRTVGRLWEFARYSIPSSFFGTMYSRFDVLLLGFLATQAAAANYEVAAKVALPALFVAQAIGNVLMPRVSSLRSHGRDATEDVTNALAFTSVLALPLFAGAVAISRPVVVTLYGEEYAGAAELLVAIAAYNLVASQGAPLRQTLSGLDRPSVNMWLSGAALAVNIVLGVALVLRVGPVGVALSTLVAEALRYAASAVVVGRELPGVDLFPRPFGEQVGASVLMLAVVVVVHRFVAVNAWYDLLVLVGAGVGVYGSVLLAVSRAHRHTLASVVNGSRVERFAPQFVLDWE